ncbi:hypothetical protein FAM09_13700 [Niastella caeni]|uniref:YceI family protein n=1 Tax=Niastella caeni TaxID=2569763 RepID=A0A4S8HVA3_9BACT|nr:hypothetical protein [Niastella caeni]THU39553.1 hypothetical protein FAM09_13700 [Niastella caeni]
MKLILLLFGTILFSHEPRHSAERWVIQKSSNLSIEGRSNINSFRCDIKEYLLPDTIYLFKDEQAMKPFTIKGALSINIKQFDCHQKYITNDFRKTLKANEQPKLKINLLNIGYNNGNAKNIKGWVSIELAGTIKKKEIDYQVQTRESDMLELNGSRKFSFSEFGLKPQQKLAGLIKVEDELTIRFQLILLPIKPGHSASL